MNPIVAGVVAGVVGGIILAIILGIPKAVWKFRHNIVSFSSGIVTKGWQLYNNAFALRPVFQKHLIQLEEELQSQQKETQELKKYIQTSELFIIQYALLAPLRRLVDDVTRRLGKSNLTNDELEHCLRKLGDNHALIFAVEDYMVRYENDVLQCREIEQRFDNLIDEIQIRMNEAKES